MNYRWYERVAAQSITTAGTDIFDLKGNDPISAIMIQVRLTGATGTPAGPADLALTRVKLVDGSRVILNCKGIALVPYHFNNLGQEPWTADTYINGVQTIGSYIIPFGRELFDPEYGINPAEFKNLQLEIQHNYANGGLGTISAATLEVYALMFDQKIPSLKGYLSMKEVYAYTMVSSGVKYIDLPVDYNIRSLMVQSRAAAKNVNSQFNALKLREDSDKHVVFDESVSVLAKFMYPQKMFIEDIYGKTNGTTQRLHYGYSCYEAHPVAMAVDSDDSIYGTNAYGPNVDLKSGTAVDFWCRRKCYMPNGMMHIPMGMQREPKDWYRPNRDSELELIVTAGSSVLSGSTLEVLLQQECMY